MYLPFPLQETGLNLVNCISNSDQQEYIPLGLTFMWTLPYSPCTGTIKQVLCLNPILHFQRRCDAGIIKARAIYTWQQEPVIELQGYYLAMKLYTVIGHVC